MMNYCEESKDEVRADNFPGKQSVKVSTSDDSGKINISRVSSFASMPWFRLKDPRIVRVSRTFGGKDRHSKVCTIRGLRDRRVRLSVPTAIQLYDLQDRLGLSQPSKVVDWLLDAAKDEIDELPPLPMIHPVNLGQSHLLDISMSSSTIPSLETDHNLPSNKERFNAMNSSDGSFPMKMSGVHDSNRNWGRGSKDDDEEQQDQGSEDDHQVEEEIPPNNSLILPRATHNNPFLFPYGSHYHLEPSSVVNLPPQQLQVVEDPHNFSIVHHQLPSTLSLSQIQPNGSNYFPFQYLRTSLVEMDPRHASQQLLMSSGSQSCPLNSLAPLCSINHHQSGRIPFGFDVNAAVASSHNSGNEPDKD